MSENIAKMILDILKDCDYRLVTKRRLQNVWLPHTNEIAGLYVREKPPVIYVRRDLRYEEMHHVQLHELAHAYLYTINKGDVSEKEVDRLAYEWASQIDGVL
jgi:hypothetical protein